MYWYRVNPLISEGQHLTGLGCSWNPLERKPYFLYVFFQHCDIPKYQMTRMIFTSISYSATLSISVVDMYRYPFQISTWVNALNLTRATFGKIRVFIIFSLKETELFLFFVTSQINKWLEDLNIYMLQCDVRITLGILVSVWHISGESFVSINKITRITSTHVQAERHFYFQKV